MRTTLVIRAEAKAPKANKANNILESASKHVADRKRILEQSRTLGMRRLNSDIEKIAKSEIDFAKRIVEELVPVKITFQQDAWNEWVSSLPVRVSMRDAKSAGVHTHGHGHATNVDVDAADEVEPAVERPIA